MGIMHACCDVRCVMHVCTCRRALIAHHACVSFSWPMCEQIHACPREQSTYFLQHVRGCTDTPSEDCSRVHPIVLRNFQFKIKNNVCLQHIRSYQ